MRKPRIKRVYFKLFGEWVWAASTACPNGWSALNWQEQRALRAACAHCAKLNQAEAYERHTGRKLEK